MQTFKVEGMTCAHCERAVTSAVQGIDPQAQVEVDLGTGLVKTDSDASAERLAKAIEAEGYRARRVAIPSRPAALRSPLTLRKSMHRALLLSTLVLGTPLASRAWAEGPQAGAYALQDGTPKVSATLTASPDNGLRRALDIAMIPVGGRAPITRYETELSKELHVIAVGADLRDFVHEHGDKPDSDGHFRVPMTFPHAGQWHVYADGVPQGLGQQVMRFDLVLGSPPSAAPQPDLAPTGLEAADGRYAARFDKTDLQAGDEVPLSLHLLRDGKPASDITPFLGVAAHAVFIDAADLSYVHVHAAPAEVPAAAGTGAPMQHAMAGMKDMPGAEGMEGMGPPLAAGAKVPPDLALHVRAPKAGTYVLWTQFTGGGKVRTVRFVVFVS